MIILSGGQSFITSNWRRELIFQTKNTVIEKINVTLKSVKIHIHIHTFYNWMCQEYHKIPLYRKVLNILFYYSYLAMDEYES